MVRFWSGREDEDRRGIKEAEELWSPPQVMVPGGSIVFSRVWEKGIYGPFKKPEEVTLQILQLLSQALEGWEHAFGCSGLGNTMLSTCIRSALFKTPIWQGTFYFRV